MNENAREMAYRYDLFVASDWTERLDELVAKHVAVPAKGRILEINCGTGARVVDVASSLEEGEVVGVDSDPERIAIAIAKAQTVKAERCSFVVGDAASLDFDPESFDLVVADASLEPPDRLAPIAAEAVRVARDGAPVAVKATLRGSFDEFFSLYWEALNELGLVDEVWAELEPIILARPTVDEALAAVKHAGAVQIRPHQRKEEFRFASGAEFLESPFVADLFLDEWLSILPPGRLEEARQAVARTIDRERAGYDFDVSAKVLVATGHKPQSD
jgi:ubiquinone/menaquinone biosynthesis C-methylase UbiE